MESLELLMHSLKSFFLPTLHKLSDQIGGGIEANGSTLGTGRKGQGRDKMGFTGSRVPDEQHVFSFVQILPSQKLSNQCFIDRGLSAEVIGIDRFDHGEIGVFDTPLGSPFLPI